MPAIGWTLGNATGMPALFAWYTVAVAFVLLPLVDALVGTDQHNPPEQEANALSSDAFYRRLTYFVVPLHVGHLMFSGWYFITLDAGWIAALGVLVSAGVVSGTTAITTAHELIHKPSKHEQWMGGALLASVLYASFKPEHLYGHHRHVATPRDGSTARRGESVYRFVARSMLRNPSRGYRLAAAALTRRGISVWSVRNEMVWWSALSLALIALAAVLGGVSGVLFFLIQAWFAIVLLEIINYVEHYGLQRALLANGRYERVTPRHSWNANHLLTNLFLFQLQRHSDHHANGARRYQALRHFDDSPQLPFGYATAVVAALLPPVWFFVMHRRLEQFDAERSDADLRHA